MAPHRVHRCKVGAVRNGSADLEVVRWVKRSCVESQASVWLPLDMFEQEFKGDASSETSPGFNDATCAALQSGCPDSDPLRAAVSSHVDR